MSNMHIHVPSCDGESAEIPFEEFHAIDVQDSFNYEQELSIFG